MDFLADDVRTASDGLECVENKEVRTPIPLQLKSHLIFKNRYDAFSTSSERVKKYALPNALHEEATRIPILAMMIFI